MESQKVVIGIEIGGTNVKVVIAPLYDDVHQIIEMITSEKLPFKELKTHKNPIDTVKEISEWIIKDNNLDSSQIHKVYISNFGPIELNKKSKDYGLILNTPKLGWKDFNVVKSFAEHLNLVPEQVKVDLDVSCAAFLEHKLGGHNVGSLVYITIGTGVGAGIVTNGHVLEGVCNPNVGHITVSRHPKDTYLGNCPIHKDCLEGLISNNAIKERKNLENVDQCAEVSDDDQIWDFIAYYIAQLCLSLLYILSTEKIIIGGGIINRQSLLEKIRSSFISINNNYVDHSNLNNEKIDNFITRTDFKNYSGIISAFNLSNA